MMKKVEWPGIATAVGTLLIVALIIVGSRDEFHLKDYLPLLTAAVAIVGVWVATWNVTRQIGIGILGREEDRIERELPGLLDAVYFCGGFVALRQTQSFYNITDAFADEGFGVIGSTLQKDVLKALPNTDQATCHIVRTRLLRCFRLAYYAQSAAKTIENRTEATRQPGEWEKGELAKMHLEIQQQRERFAEMRDSFGAAMDELEEMIRAINRKIELYEARSARIRGKIEEFFDKSDR